MSKLNAINARREYCLHCWAVNWLTPYGFACPTHDMATMLICERFEQGFLRFAQSPVRQRDHYEEPMACLRLKDRHARAA